MGMPGRDQHQVADGLPGSKQSHQNRGLVGALESAREPAEPGRQ